VETIVESGELRATEKATRRREQRGSGGAARAANAETGPPRAARTGAAGALRRPSRKEHNLELFGLATLAFSVLVLISLFSYDPADVSGTGTAVRTGETANVIGPVGANLADLLLHLFGAASFLLAGLLGLVGGVLFFNRKVVVSLPQVVGFLLCGVSLTALTHLLFRGERLLSHLPGGLAGELFGELGRSMLGSVGSGLLATCILLIAVLLATGLSLAAGVRRLGSATARCASATWAGARAGSRAASDRLGDLLTSAAAADEPLAPGPAPVASVAPLPVLPVLPRPAEDPLEGWSFGEVAPDPGPVVLAGSGGWSFGGEPLADPVVDLPGPATPSAPPATSTRRRRALPGQSLAAPAEPRIVQHTQPERAVSDVVFFQPAPTPPAGVSDGQATSAEEADANIVVAALSELDLPVAVAAGEPDDEDDDEALPLAPPAGRPRQETLPYVSPRAPSGPPPTTGGRTPSPLPGPAIVPPRSVNRELPLELLAGLEQERLGEQPQTWDLPPLTLLDYTPRSTQDVDRQALLDMAVRLEGKLANYGVKGKVREIHPGPVVTMFEFEPGPGIRISKIANLSDDLAMSLEAVRVRIVAPIPGKGVVGIEVPSQRRETVYLKELIADTSFQKSRMRLPLCLGKDIMGFPIVRDLGKMPHLLTAGATGSGKSVLVNCMVVSLLYRYSPEELRLIMVDPKQLEFALYEGIPHLLLPVVTDPKKAAVALRWAVAEMERRYTLLADVGVRNLADYNKWVESRQAELDDRPRPARGIRLDEEGAAVPSYRADEVPQKLPAIVVIIDEFAELMMVASKDVETSVCRLAQKARASGIHLILATQRPSVDVITGVIKANFPARIGLQVAQREDSRTILGQCGAENLLGDGDMLIMSPGAAGLTRAHGPLVTDEEIRRVCDNWRQQGAPSYDLDILTLQEKESEDEPAADEAGLDEMYDMAVRVVAEARLASASMLQRRLRIGYNRAARLVEIMEREGVVGPADGARPREVLVPPPMDL